MGSGLSEAGRDALGYVGESWLLLLSTPHCLFYTALHLAECHVVSASTFYHASLELYEHVLGMSLLAGGGILALSLVPQVIKLLLTRSAADISLLWSLLYLLGEHGGICTVLRLLQSLCSVVQQCEQQPVTASCSRAITTHRVAQHSGELRSALHAMHQQILCCSSCHC
jgi:hypothetical protein